MTRPIGGCYCIVCLVNCSTCLRLENLTMHKDKVTRREFVRDATGAAAGVAVGLSAAHAAPEQPAVKTRSYNEKMEYRRLGKTGLMISAISIGGHWKKIPFRFGTKEFAKNRRDVLSACIDSGINYVDACTGSEVLAYADALRGRREKMYLGCSDCGREVRNRDWQTTKKLLYALDDLLRRAKLEYVDLWRITCYWQPHTNHTVEQEHAMVEALDKAHKAGKARFTGISTHKHDWAIRMIETYPKHIQVLVVPYTADSKHAHARVDPEGGWHGVKEKPEAEKPNIFSLIDAVKKHDVGWIGIKPFASGSVFKSRGAPNSATKKEDDEVARMTLRYVLCNDALTAAIPGLITIDQVKNAARAVLERREFDKAEAERYKKVVSRMWANLPEGYDWLRDWEYV